MTVKERTSCWSGNKCTCLVFMLVAVSIAVLACITFLVQAVRAPHPRDAPKWWQTTIIYQIYPPSFQDSNGDGTGDLKGIISRMDYFNTINVSAIWLNPFYKSPMRDFGYDVSDYLDVNPVFGDMDDFDQLVIEAHDKGIKVIVDFVPNHTSNESDWFNRSRHASQGDRYRDFYIWNVGRGHNGDRQPPNNWSSVFEGSAWEWDPVRQEYYYHAFLASQPDLNLRNNDVLLELDNVLRFWLDKGVDGVRVDAIPYLFEITDLSQNDPLEQTDSSNADAQQNTRDQPEIFDVVRRWRTIMDEYEANDNNDRLIIVETVGISSLNREKYFDAGSEPFYFKLIWANEKCNATADCFKKLILEGLNTCEGCWPNFVIGNHDNKRVLDRMGEKYVDSMNMLLLTLPGTPTTYYGEELGMAGGNYQNLQPKDPYAITSNNTKNSRDSERNPMQWSSSANAGFSNCTPTSPTSYCTWLKITDNTHYKTINVETEHRSDSSSLTIYKYLAQVRQSPAFQSLNIEIQTQGNLLLYKRWSDTDDYLVALNLGKTTDSFHLEEPTGRIVVATKVSKINQEVSLASVTLEAGEGLLIQL